MNDTQVPATAQGLAELVSKLEHAAMGYQADPQSHTERRMVDARKALFAALASEAQGARSAEATLPPLNDALIEILGRPNFACAELAMALRADGHQIKHKAEHEQAAVLHWMLGIYLKHGEAWHEQVGIELTRIAEEAR